MLSALIRGDYPFPHVQPAIAIPAIVATFENIQTGTPVAEVATIAVATPTDNMTVNVYELDSPPPISKGRNIWKLADLCAGSRDIVPEP